MFSSHVKWERETSTLEAAAAADLIVHVFTPIDPVFDHIPGTGIMPAVHPVFTTVIAVFGAVHHSGGTGGEQEDTGGSEKQ